MGTRARQEYFAVLRERYRKLTSKKERSVLVSEAIQNTNLHRKSILRALNSDHSLTGRNPNLGRPRRYSDECIGVLKTLYRASEYQCSHKLKEMIPMLLKHSEMDLSESVEAELKKISSASIDRYLGAYRKLERRKKNSGTRTGSRLFKKIIPLKSLSLIPESCGRLEADTVAHCGGNMSGDFVWSITVTDVYSGWTENRAMFGKYAKFVLQAIESIHEAIPFEIISFNVDNGSEFLNYQVHGYFENLAKTNAIPSPLTRSRSYRKNDNAHVEQKNWTHVRQFFGYDRFEFKELIPVMNKLYEIQNLMTNFFIPQFKLKSSERHGSKVKKKYFKPITPYQWVLEDPKVPEDSKLILREKYSQLNFFELRKRKEAYLAYFIKLHTQLRSESKALPQGSLLQAVR